MITLAKLKLYAAVLLAALCYDVREALENRTRRIHLWTDSTIVISWIRTTAIEIQVN